jgi:hypothetical protein
MSPRGTADNREGMCFSGLRIVVFPETPKTWVARSLEHDLSATGRTADAAIDTLIRMVDAHVAYDLRHGHQPLAAFASAPRMYWQAFVAASKQAAPVEVNRNTPSPAVRCVVGYATQNPALRRITPRIA